MATNAPKISVVICTHDRCNDVVDAIDSVLSQDVAPDIFEVVVVDNASRDETETVIREKYANASQLRYVREPTLGLSHARNAGIRESSGRYIAFLDDDAIADDQWLLEIVSAFESGADGIACISGKVDPLWQAPRPVWLSDELAGYLSVVDWSPVPIVLRRDQWIAGANMAFLCDTLRAVGGFPAILGRRGHNLLSGEETFVRRRIEANGQRVYYVPAAVVHHKIPVTRLTKMWFRRRAYWQGVTDAVMYRAERGRVSITQLAGAVWRMSIAVLRNFGHLPDTREQGRGRLVATCRSLHRVGFVVGLIFF